MYATKPTQPPKPDAKEALILAIGRARLKFKPLRREAEGMIGKRTFSYVELGSMVDAIEGALKDEGVSFIMGISGTDTTTFWTSLTVAGHGGELTTSLPLPMPDRSDGTWIQELGRISTYARRYLLNAFFALDCIDDADAVPGYKDQPRRDERVADQRPEPRAPVRVESAPAPAKHEPPPKSAPKATAQSAPATTGTAEPTLLKGDVLMGALTEQRNRLGLEYSMVKPILKQHFNKSFNELSVVEKQRLLEILRGLPTPEALAS